MRKLAICLVLCFGAISVFADDTWEILGEISISSTATPAKIVQPTLIQFAGSTPRARNCVTKISVTADNFPPTGFTVTILDGGTTSYQMTVTTGPLVDFWDFENPLPLTTGTSTFIQVSTGNYKVNATGYLRSR